MMKTVMTAYRVKVNRCCASCQYKQGMSERRHKGLPEGRTEGRTEILLQPMADGCRPEERRTAERRRGSPA